MACVAIPACVAHAQAPLPQGYPQKPVRIIIGSSPGGGVDAITRPVGQKLADHWNRAVIVDNRAGGSGVIAMDITAQAAADGYTLMSASTTMILNGVLKKVAYDIRKAYTPVVQMTTQAYMLIVVPALPVYSVKELLAYAKSRPGALSYASAGMGSAQHLGMELFKSMAAVDMVHVPYKGSGPALVDLLGGQIHLMFTSTISGTSHVKSGKLRAIAVTGLRRVQAYPELPTVAEAGVPGYELSNSYALYAPSGVPPGVVIAINRAVGSIMTSPEMRDMLAADGAEAAAPSSPDEFRQAFVREVDKWEKHIAQSPLKL